MYRKLGEYAVVAAITALLFLSFVSFLQIETLDFRITYVIVPACVVVLSLMSNRAKIVVLTSFRENTVFAHCVTVSFLTLLPFMLRQNAYLIHICIMIGLYTIMALGLNVYLGSIGMVNFCFGAYFGMGAYTSALLSTTFHVSFWVTLILAGLAGLLGGILVSMITLKNKGFYYVLVTFAFQQVFHLMVNNMGWTGGPDGVVNIPFPRIGNYSLGHPLIVLGIGLPFQANFYYLSLGLCIVTMLAVTRINRSRTALQWNAIRDDEIAASCYGINLLWGKVEAGAVGAFFGGVAGPLYAHYVGYISPEVFSWEVSAALLSMVILGGINNVYGVTIGVTILTVLTEKFQLVSNYRTLIFGIVILGCLIFKPGGFIPERLRDYQRIMGAKRSLKGA